MNDRYLYRAKTRLIVGTYNSGKKDGEWVKGYLYCDTGRWMIKQFEFDRADYVDYEVDPSTICQCTAMPDKNRKIAYEHDIIKTPVGNAKIIWNCSPSPTDDHINVGFEIVFLDAIENDNYRHDLGYWIGKSEVIGSVFDNLELLE